MRSHSPPFKGRGWGGVSIFLTDRILQTPPLPLPLKGGEWLRLRARHVLTF